MSLSLELSPSQPEDVELYVKLEDAPLRDRVGQGKYVDIAPLERTISPPNGELKERFMESMRDTGSKDVPKSVKSSGKIREKSQSTRPIDIDVPKPPVEIVVGTALKRGGRGRPVQVSTDECLTY